MYLSLIEDLSASEVVRVKRQILKRLRVEVTAETASRVGIPRASDGTVCYLDGVEHNPLQQQLHFPTPENDWRYLVLCTGKRASKSISDAAEVVCEMAFRRRHIWIVAPTYHLTDNVFRWVWRWVVEQRCFGPDSVESSGTHKSRDRRSIRLKNSIGGSFVEGKSAESPISLMGVPLNLIVLDEAAFVPEMIFSDKLEPNTVDYHARTIFSSTPNGRNWYERYFERGRTIEDRSVGWRSFHCETEANPFIDKEYLESKRRRTSEILWKQNYLGLFEAMAGLVWPDFSHEHVSKGGHLIRPSEFDLSERSHWLGLDIGISHATAGVWGAVDRAGQVIIYRDYCEVESSYGEHADAIRARNSHKLAGGFISPDATRTQPSEKGRQDNARKAFLRRGLPVRPASDNLDLGISVVSEYLRATTLSEGQDPGMLISTECADLVAALQSYVWATDRTGEPTGRPRKKNDDLADALRYLMVARPSHQPARGVRARYGDSGGIEVPVSAMRKYGDIYIPGGFG